MQFINFSPYALFGASDTRCTYTLAKRSVGQSCHVDIFLLRPTLQTTLSPTLHSLSGWWIICRSSDKYGSVRIDVEIVVCLPKMLLAQGKPTAVTRDKYSAVYFFAGCISILQLTQWPYFNFDRQARISDFSDTETVKSL